MRVLLLNPPGSRPYLRDYHCSKVSKAGYVYHPVDLTFQSGLLDAGGHEVHVLDAIADKLTPHATLRRIARIRPDALLSLVGAAAWDEDRAFLHALRRDYSGVLGLTGDVFLETPRDALNQLPTADIVFTDFTQPAFVDFLATPDSIPPHSLVRQNDTWESGPTPEKSGSFSIPLPRYDRFPHKKYHYPFVRRRPFATVLTDYGCRFPCSYCIMSTLGNRFRPLDNVLAELHWLWKHWYRDLYINDQTFGANRARTMELLDAMTREGLEFGWVCFTRADVFDEELASAMRSAGCHTVMFGVEHAYDDILASYARGMRPGAVASAFATARRYGLRTVATFLLGLPEDNEHSIRDTIDLALALNPDFASFNFAVPRRGTGIRARALEMGIVGAQQVDMDQAGESIAMRTQYLSREEVARLRKDALRAFYGRPGYIVKRAARLRTPYEIRTTVREGAAVLKGLTRWAPATGPLEHEVVA